MKAVADQVAIAMARVKLNEELRQLNEDLEQRINKRTSELKTASLYSRILLESSLDPLVTISPKGKITDVNRATELATGLDRGELIGTDFAEYFTDPDAAKAGYMKVLADGDVRDYPLTINNTMGKMTDVLFNATVFPNEKGQLQGVFAAARDVTQLKKAELELREAKDNLEMINKELQLEISEHEKTEKLLLEAKEAAESAVLAKEAFMANMSHEIRTPMNAVIGMTSLLLDEDLTAEQKSFVEVIRSGGDAMLSIINEILDFSRLEKKRIELENQVLHLPSIIEEALDLAAPKAAEKKLNLAYMVDKKTPNTIMGDPTRIRQVLVNLLDNAVKFTEKGEVAVSVSSKLSDSMHDIHFSIKDTGIGIPAERLGSIFEPFNQADNSITRKYGGTGLGLTISRKLANLMGGDIWVESNAGNGSTFHFNILAKAAPGQPRSEGITRLFKDKSILVVENNKTNRRILGRLAKDWGMIPTTASSVKEAWKLIQAENGFDIAIVEMDAPEIDGIALGQEIRKHDKDMPIVMLTYAGHKVESDMFQATLAKPIKPTQLYNILKNVFSSQYAIVPVCETDKEDSKKSPLKILLAEDNFQSQKVIMQMLSKLGFSADLAANGLEALQALERQRYDIILMDVRMPEMNGLDATRIIRQRWPGAKPIIIAVTAYGLEGDREKCLDAGMDDYISKPIKLKDLQSIIGKYTMPSNNESSILRG
jgi:PAS domain S-box-containing protein